MALFGRRKPDEAQGAPAGPKPQGPGRRLSSSLGVEDSLTALGAAVGEFSPPPYEHMPALAPAGYTWLSDASPPARVVAFTGEADGSPVMAALFDDGRATEIGLFPLGSGPGALQLPIIGFWKRQDRSLSSIGEFPGGLIRFEVPTLPEDFVADLLRRGDHPVTASNLVAAEEEVARMFALKAYQFMSSQNETVARRFLDEHEGAAPQRILDDLGGWNPGVVPYIQDLPGRVRGLLLEGVGDGRTFWARLER